MQQAPGPPRLRLNNVPLSLRVTLYRAFNRLGAVAFFFAIVLLPSVMGFDAVARSETGPVHVSIYASDLALAASVILWLLAHVLEPGREIRLGPLYVWGPALTLLTFSLLSPLWAVDPLVALAAAAPNLLYFLSYLLAINERCVSRLLTFAFAVTLLVEAPVAIAQFLRQAPVGLAILGEGQPATGLFRSYGLTPHTNILGGILAISAIVVAAMAISRQGVSVSRRVSVPPTVIVALVSAIGVGGLLSAFSRSALLAYGIDVVFLAFLEWRHRAVPHLPTRLACWAAPPVVLLALLVIAYPKTFEARVIVPGQQLLSGRQLSTSLEQRDTLVRDSFRLIETSPLLGVGIANYSLAIGQRVENLGPKGSMPVHFVPLLVTAELGPIAGLAWLIWPLAPIVVTLRRNARYPTIWPRVWSAALLTVLVISAFDYYFWSAQQARALCWVLAGAWAGSIGTSDRRRQVSQETDRDLSSAGSDGDGT